MIPPLSKLPSCQRLLLRCNLLMVPEMRYKQILLEKRGNMTRTHIWHINTQCKWNLREDVSRLCMPKLSMGCQQLILLRSLLIKTAWSRALWSHWSGLLVRSGRMHGRSIILRTPERSTFVLADNLNALNLVWLSTERSGQTGNSDNKTCCMQGGMCGVVGHWSEHVYIYLLQNKLCGIFTSFMRAGAPSGIQQNLSGWLATSVVVDPLMFACPFPADRQPLSSFWKGRRIAPGPVGLFVWSHHWLALLKRAV